MMMSRALFTTIFVFVQCSALVFYPYPSYAQYQCAVDIDNDGTFTTVGEVLDCQGLYPDTLCPIDSANCTANPTTPQCPDGISTCDTLTEQCAVQYQQCLPYFAPAVPTIPSNDYFICQNTLGDTDFFATSLADCNANCSNDCISPTTPLSQIDYPNLHQCDDSGLLFTDETSCNTTCASPINRTCTIPDSYTCPLDSHRPCMEIDGSQQCSLHPCFDPDTTVTTPVQPPEGQDYVDDGVVDSLGNCTELQLIFNGKVSECKPAGISNAYKNCCSNEEEVYTDSVGASVEDTLTTEAIAAVAAAAAAGSAAAASAVASGATAAETATAAQTAVADSLTAAVDPTTLVIAIIVALIVSYVLQGCPPEEITTAQLADSDMCVLVGEYCHREVFGSCAQDTRRFCCFNSRLAKLIHVQGRPQLSTFPDGFGTVDAPNCRGFTPTEFQSLDFSKIDFTDYFDQLRTDTQEEINEKVLDGIEEYQDVLSNE